MPTKETKTTATTKTRTRSPLKLYFLLITLTGVIGSLITVGMLVFSIAKKAIITDQEYIISERYYELDACNNPVLKQTMIQTTTTTNVPPMMGQTNTTTTVAQPQATATPTETYVQPTDADKEKCKADKTAQLILSRSATFKSDVLGSAIRAILFVALLSIHYGRFMRTRKED